MKRIANLNAAVHVADTISTILSIIVCDNVETTPLTLHQPVQANMEIDDIYWYSGYSDEDLLSLDDGTLHTITDPKILERVGKIDYNRLSKTQRTILKDALSQNQNLDEDDIQIILKKLKMCNRIFYEGRHTKTNAFLFNSDGQFRNSECLSIIHQLTMQDITQIPRSYNPNHLGNSLIVFQPRADLKFEDGTIVKNLLIYLKLDVDESNGQTVALVSMHEAEHADPKLYHSAEIEE